MKKITLMAALIVAFSMNSQNTLLDEGFDDIATLTEYTVVNVSDDPNLDILQGSTTVFDSFDGDPTAYLGFNFNATGGSVIDLYVITPELNLSNGDELTFYTRTATASNFPDRLEIRLDTDASGTAPTSSDNGSYTELLLEINPTLTIGGYPEDWEQQVVTISGLPDGGLVTKVAFRYWVTDGGPLGSNSNYIGIDRLVVDAALSTEDILSSNLNVFVDSKQLKINSSESLTEMKLFNLLGQNVKTVSLEGNSNTVDLSLLPTGLYVSQISSANATTSLKILNK
ncbi:choice-of-anchor J domain-containing protein [uncultured Dokdonia sp.]|uniref:T9SS-dependent choice-of-anchor J family protein n=1 Tax=uncultured Dokdonia sp. TaxID=575653 RepID=UPI0030EE3DEE|tara:strand:- start:37707 stop:38558 length:852 start_codon:yes stop_codon:yes gene_type:complete